MKIYKYVEIKQNTPKQPMNQERSQEGNENIILKQMKMEIKSCRMHHKQFWK